MDFSFDESQTAVRDLAKKLCKAEATVDRLKEIEKDESRFDRRLWSELAQAQLLGIALKEDVGGGGLGLIELCLVLEQIGKTVAYVPVYPTLMLGALPIDQFGTDEQRQKYLPRVIAGELVTTAALGETGADDLLHPTVTARKDGAGWRLDGVKECVVAGSIAGLMLVPAKTGEGSVGVFLVDPTAAGVKRESQTLTTGEPASHVTFSGAVADGALGDPNGGTAIIRWMQDRAIVGLCALQVGICESAVRMTAEYATSRQQFDRPIATFQAVAQRAGDAYIDTEVIRLALWQAVWLLSEGRDAARAVVMAKYWASEAGHRVVSAAQHIHGGMGFDRDYPVHRYYLAAKQIEFSLGGAASQLAKLGGMIREGR